VKSADPAILGNRFMGGGKPFIPCLIARTERYNSFLRV
jgi:hypothetical protein